MPFAWKAYNEIGEELGVTAISQKNIIDFFPNPFMRENFLSKIGTGDIYVHTYPEQNNFNNFFNYEFGCGEIRPVYTAHLETLLPHWRKQLLKSEALLEKVFDLDKLVVEHDRINYEGITADKIIFCDGTASFDNPFFKQLPFAPNKGESLLVEIPGLPTQWVYKKSMLLAPMEGKDANIVISEGDILDMRTSIISAVFIQGRKVSLENKQTQLYKRYMAKYGLK